jgi:hypothetical protein
VEAPIALAEVAAARATEIMAVITVIIVTTVVDPSASVADTIPTPITTFMTTTAIATMRFAPTASGIAPRYARATE